MCANVSPSQTHFCYTKIAIDRTMIAVCMSSGRLDGAFLRSLFQELSAIVYTAWMFDLPNPKNAYTERVRDGCALIDISYMHRVM